MEGEEKKVKKGGSIDETIEKEEKEEKKEKVEKFCESRDDGKGKDSKQTGEGGEDVES